MRLAASAVAALALAPATPASNYTAARDACCGVFGRYGAACLRVVRCETGGTYSVYARNGQYLGLFQMGAYARSRYGHSWTAYGQARAAFRYFAATGYSWRPWSCKP